MRVPPVTPGAGTRRTVDEQVKTMRSVEGSHRRAALVVVAAVCGLLLAGGATAHAQLGGSQFPFPGWDDPTPPTTAAPQPGEPSPTTTTTQPRLQLPGREQPTTTTAPPPPPGSAPAEPVPPGEGDGTGTQGRGAMPPELQALMNSVRRSPANNTRALLAALAPLSQYGLDPTQQAIVGFGRFPVAGETVWSDDWWFPRFGPGWRLHQGLDMFAPHGTPVRAPVDGRIRVTNGGLGGLSVYVVQPDKTYWYLTHLSGIAPGIAEGVEVKTGQVVGFVGTSGNAAGGKPHLHIEIHPKGGPAVPPKPVMDKFVTDALALAPQLLQAYADAAARGQQAPAAAAPAAAPAPELTTLTPRAALLWASAANPAGGTLRLVEADAAAAAGRIDWNAVIAAEAKRAEEQALVDLWLGPLVPRALAEAIGMDRMAGGPR
jgi:peptidoglycan LD-endopeptidase LytH